MNIHVSPDWFQYIKSGQKTVEGRLYKSKFTDVYPGMAIFIHTQDEHMPLKMIVERVARHESFASMLEKEGLATVLPQCPDIQTGIDIYRAFYSKEDEEKYGVVAIGLKEA